MSTSYDVLAGNFGYVIVCQDEPKEITISRFGCYSNSCKSAYFDNELKSLIKKKNYKYVSKVQAGNRPVSFVHVFQNEQLEEDFSFGFRFARYKNRRSNKVEDSFSLKVAGEIVNVNKTSNSELDDDSSITSFAKSLGLELVTRVNTQKQKSSYARVQILVFRK